MSTEKDVPIHPITSSGAISIGLTKREYFAAMAMQGMCSNMDNANLQNCAEAVAHESVRFADALIKQLNKEGE